MPKPIATLVSFPPDESALELLEVLILVLLYPLMVAIASASYAVHAGMGTSFRSNCVW